MVKYEYFLNNSLIIIKYYGLVDKTELITTIDFLLTKTNTVSLNKVITDLRDVNLTFSAKELVEVNDILVLKSKGLNLIHEVLLVSKPKETALSILFSNSYFENWKFDVCSTLEYCIRKLSLNLTNQELGKMIQDLKFCYSKC